MGEVVVRAIWIVAGVGTVLVGIDGGHAQPIMQPDPPPMPKVNYPDGAGQHTVARRSGNGMFALRAEINGTTLPMVFDTGASMVVIRAEDADRVGIDMNSLTYSGHVSTANGDTAVAPVTIDTLTIDGITRHKVKAIVSKPGQLRVNLLGQSFIARLAGYKLDGDKLILQDE